jgi:hypothetical protein
LIFLAKSSTLKLPKRSRGTCCFCPSDLTALNKSHHPPLVIPSEAEGPAVRPGSRTKVSVPLVPPQTRPRRCSSYPCSSEFFNHRSRHRAGLLRFFPGALHCISQPILLSGLGGRKAPSSMGRMSTAEVPSATLRTGSSTPRHQCCVTRSIGEALRSG